MHYKQKQDQNGNAYLEVNQTDFDLIRNPLLNKGSAFPEEERSALKLHGLLPPAISSLDIQLERSYNVFKSKQTDLEKYIYLRELQDSNETLFYSLIEHHITEMMPIVYTPTVGAGCQSYSLIYRRPRGLYLTYAYKDQLDQLIAHPHFDNVEAIVVSDGERILGLGDQGVGGMGIPVGKLALYSACAGIHPASTLPILLDTGTNNPDLLMDPLYMGWRHERVRGKEYDDFIEAFVKAVKKRWPHVLLQWEDFAKLNANPILAKYRDELCTFNDDIQGTAAVATGALLAAMQAAGTHLSDQRIVIVGAGSAGCGISNLIVEAMVDAGLALEEARSRFYLIDSNGLLLDDNQALQSFQQPLAQAKSAVSNWKIANAAKGISLQDVIENAHPTVMVGVSGQTGLFTEEIVKSVLKYVSHPIIFPLSNPTSKAEATPEDIMKWTEGRAVVGTGSPFPPLMVDGKLRRVDQTNNSYIFPGMGLGIITVKSKRVTDRMFMAAAKALAAFSPAKTDPKANLLPPLDEIREVSFRVAFATAKEAISEGLADAMTDEELSFALRQKMWTPGYLPYRLEKKA